MQQFKDIVGHVYTSPQSNTSFAALPEKVLKSASYSFSLFCRDVSWLNLFSHPSVRSFRVSPSSPSNQMSWDFHFLFFFSLNTTFWMPICPLDTRSSSWYPSGLGIISPRAFLNSCSWHGKKQAGQNVALFGNSCVWILRFHRFLLLGGTSQCKEFQILGEKYTR